MEPNTFIHIRKKGSLDAGPFLLRSLKETQMGKPNDQAALRGRGRRMNTVYLPWPKLL